MIHKFQAQGSISFKFSGFLDTGNKANEGVRFASNGWIYYGLN